MAKKLTDDQIRWILSLDATGVQTELHKLDKETKTLKNTNKDLRNEMVKLESQGKKGSNEWTLLNNKLKENNKALADNKAQVAALNKELSIEQKTMAQLRRTARELQTQLDNTSKALNPQEYAKIKNELSAVNNRMGELKRGTDKAGGSVKKLGTAGLATGAKFGIAGLLMGAVIKAGKDLVKTYKAIQATGDKLAITIGGITEGWEYFQRALLTGSWDNFFKNIGDAITAGREFAAIMDDLGDRTRAYQIMESEYRQDISALENQLKNVNLTNKERIEIADIIITKEEELAERQKSLAKQEFDALLTREAKRAGLQEDDLKYYIRKYDENKELIKQAEEYIDIQKNLAAQISSRAQSMPGLTLAPQNNADEGKIARYNDAIANTSEEVKKFTLIHQNYQRTTDEGLDAVTASWVKYNNVTTEYNNNVSQAYVRKQRLIKQEGKDEKTAEQINEEAYNKELKALEQSISEQRILILRNALNTKKTKQETDAQILAHEQSSLQERINLNKKYNKDYSTLTIQQLNEQIKIRNEAYNNELKALEQSISEQRILILRDALNTKKTKQETDAQILALERSSLQKRINLNKKYNKDYSTLTIQQLNEQIKFYEDFEKQIAASTKRINDILQKSNDDTYKSATDALEKESDELAKQIEKDLEAWDEKLKEAGRIREEYDLKSAESKRDTELDILKQTYDDGLIMEKEYVIAAAKIWANYMSEKIEDAQKFVTLASDAYDAYSEAQFAKLEAEKEKELTLAGNDAEKRKQIEEEYAQKELDLEKDQADTKFAIQIAQIVASTALSIMQAYSQLGPIAGSVAAALLGATGAFQVSAAKAERDKVKNMSLNNSSSDSAMPTAQRVVVPTAAGFAGGGYTGAGERYQPAGIVHKDEYVVAQPEMRNPVAFKYVQALDNLRSKRTGDNSSLPGYAAGGMVTNQNQSDPLLISLLQKNASLLSSLIENGIEATTNFSYSKFDTGQKRINYSKTTGSK